MYPHRFFCSQQSTAIRLAFLTLLLASLTALLVIPSVIIGGVLPKMKDQKQEGAAAPSGIVPGVVVVKLKRSAPITDGALRQAYSPLSSAIARLGVTSLARAFPMRTPLSDTDIARGKVDLSQIHFAAIPSSMNPVEVAAQLALLPEVEYAEPKYMYHLADVPNDSDYAVWQQRYFDRMHVAEGWTLQKGSPHVVIATVDGGTNWQHPDLEANIWINPAEDINHNGRFDPGPPSQGGDEDGIDQDGNGKIDDVIGWNFTYNSNNPRGSQSTPASADHGTETASLFGAVTNNGLGMAGTSWNCRLMPICAADARVDNSIAYGIEGIEYASRMGARVINCSWSRDLNSANFSQFEQDVITAVWQDSVLVVAAAGNKYPQDLDDIPFYPASYDHVLSVGATNSGSDEIAYFTDIGLNVSTFAPGTVIRVAKDNGSYGKDQGTSHSSPLVAGLAGLLFSAHPDWSPDQVAEQIRITSDPIDAVNPEHAGSLGHGRVNFYRALSEVHSGVHVIARNFHSPSGKRFFLQGDTVMLSVQVKNDLPLAAENLTFRVSADPVLVPLSPVSGPGRLDHGDQALVECAFLVDSLVRERDVKVRLSWTANGNEQDARMFVTPVYAGKGYWERQMSPTTMTLTSIYAVNSSVAWAVGYRYMEPHSVVLRTTDGGDNWVVVNSGLGLYTRCVFARDSLHALVNGYVDGVGGKLYVTNDGGASWREQNYPQPQAFFFSGFWFFDASSGYALGNPQTGGKFVILRTTDGGATWAHLANEPVAPSGVTISLNALWCTDTQHIWFGTTDSKVWRTSNGGESWLSTPIGGSTINGLAMHDDSVGILCAGRDADPEPMVFARTTDGGATWQTIPGVKTDKGLAAAYQPHSLEAWIAGDQSVAYSHDNGENWTVQPTDRFNGVIDAVSILDSKTGWMVTDQGEILRYHVSGPTTSVGQGPRQNVPMQVLLEQNYPNPFNPSTTIQYALPLRSHVTLTVFNMLGQLVATLVNDEVAAGYHQVTFEASSFASGVYFYRFQAGNVSQTRKLVLLR